MSNSAFEQKLKILIRNHNIFETCTSKKFKEEIKEFWPRFSAMCSECDKKYKKSDTAVEPWMYIWADLNTHFDITGTCAKCGELLVWQYKKTE